jgi:transposase
MLSGADEIYLAVGATDLRKGIDGLAIMIQEHFALDPFSKKHFVFCNRSKDKLKILEWAGTGFWLHYFRLEKGSFKWPDGKSEAISIDSRQFRWLLDGLTLDEQAAHPYIKERLIV